jgi:hypothetical protein
MMGKLREDRADSAFFKVIVISQEKLGLYAQKMGSIATTGATTCFAVQRSRVRLASGYDRP